MRTWSQQRQWSAFVAVIGLVLIVLTGFAANPTALLLGAILVVAGLIGVLLG